MTKALVTRRSFIKITALAGGAWSSPSISMLISLPRDSGRTDAGERLHQVHARRQSEHHQQEP
jgi:hypothetical protein